MTGRSTDSGWSLSASQGSLGETLAMRTPDKVYREEPPDRVRHPEETPAPRKTQSQVLAKYRHKTWLLLQVLERPHRSNVLSSVMLVKAFHFPKCFFRPRAGSMPSHREL